MSVRPLTTFQKEKDVNPDRLNALIDELCKMINSTSSEFAAVDKDIVAIQRSLQNLSTAVYSESRFFQGVDDTNIIGIVLQNTNGDAVYVWPNAAGNGLITRTTKP